MKEPVREALDEGFKKLKRPASGDGEQWLYRDVRETGTGRRSTYLMGKAVI